MITNGPQLIEARLTFRTLTGAPLAIGAEVLDDGDDGVVLHATLEWPVWERARSQGLFHLDAAVPGDPPPFLEPGRPLRLGLRLRPLLAAAGVAEIARQLTSDPTSAALATEAWEAISVRQAVDLPADLEEEAGSAELGLRTLLAGDPADLGLAVSSFLQAAGFEYETLDPTFFRVHAEPGEDREWLVVFQTDAELGTVHVSSILPVHAPESIRAQVALELGERNYVSRGGSWEVDPDDGQVRYRTLVIGGDHGVSAHQLDTATRDNLSAMLDAWDALNERIQSATA